MKRRKFLALTGIGAAVAAIPKIATGGKEPLITYPVKRDSTPNVIHYPHLAEGEEEVIKRETVLDPETFQYVSKKWIRNRYGLAIV